MNSIVTVAKVMKIGNSMGIILTKPLKLMGVEEGDIVTVSISTSITKETLNSACGRVIASMEGE